MNRTVFPLQLVTFEHMSNFFFDIADMSPLQLCARKFGSKNNKFSLYTAVENSL